MPLHHPKLAHAFVRTEIRGEDVFLFPEQRLHELGRARGFCFRPIFLGRGIRRLVALVGRRRLEIRLVQIPVGHMNGK